MAVQARLSTLPHTTMQAMQACRIRTSEEAACLLAWSALSKLLLRMRSAPRISSEREKEWPRRGETQNASWGS